MVQAAPTREHVCVNCGICCGGALFDQAKVTPEEVPGLRALGFAIEMEGEQAMFRLPCGQLSGTVCQVYAERPATCRTHRCATLRALDSGKIDRREAERRIALTKAAIAQVRALLRTGETLLQLRVRFGEDRDPAPEFQLAMLAWDMLMDRYFRRPHQRVLQPG